MATLTRPLLLRLVSTLVLAISATVLSAGTAQAVAPIGGRSATLGPGPRDAAAAADIAAAPRNSTISVLLANDQLLFRSGMRAVIDAQTDLRCVAEVGDGAAAVHELTRLRPDIAILDLDMPGFDEPATIDSIAELAAGGRILTLATEDSDENLYRALRLGACGFLTKSLPAQDLLAAIRTAAQRDALIDPRRTRHLITRLTHGIDPFPTAPELAALTPREHQVLLLMAEAHTNPEIAAALGVGEQTVKTHVSNVLAKLGVRDRVQAVVYAHTRRIVPAGRSR
ncbi:LuxR C-terminal-related transcriptional regulator [Nocardia inohanensis]|uniref:LuxR C-terminal-related transcriptional regulator n=1 Tax=Nocardia inohanensis TaxID=209246 RepID=UPI000A01F9D9|nr:response regulator transcription factor [Nocardia inohanensis]